MRMVSILPPDSSMTFIVGVAGPLILGFLVGIVLKSTVKIGVALIAIVLALIVIGVVSPNQVIGGVLSVFRSGSALTVKVDQIAGYLPYSSASFIIGAAIGFLKG